MIFEPKFSIRLIRRVDLYAGKYGTDCVNSEAYIPMSTIVLFVRLTITGCEQVRLKFKYSDLCSLWCWQLLIVIRRSWHAKIYICALWEVYNYRLWPEFAWRHLWTTPNRNVPIFHTRPDFIQLYNKFRWQIDLISSFLYLSCSKRDHDSWIDTMHLFSRLWYYYLNERK